MYYNDLVDSGTHKIHKIHTHKIHKIHTHKIHSGTNTSVPPIW